MAGWAPRVFKVYIAGPEHDEVGVVVNKLEPEDILREPESEPLLLDVLTRKTEHSENFEFD